MKKARSDTRSPNPVTEMHLLVALANAVASIETANRRFRNAVLVRLSRIETMVQMVHGAQIVEAHKSEPSGHDKMRQHAKDAEEYVSESSREMGIKMVEYIYGESEALPTKRKTRQKSPSL